MQEMRKELIGKTVSVLIDGLKGREAYVAILKDLDDEWCILEMPGGKYDQAYIRTKAIISILRKTEAYEPR